MQIPLSGPFNFLHAVGGIVLGLIINVLVVKLTVSHYGTLTGPALKAADIAEACNLSVLATVGWCIVYWNMIGANVCCIFSINAFKLIPEDKVNQPAFTNVASRFAGNSAEHAPVFLAALWVSTMFSDATTTGILGLCYVGQRLLYPLVYMVLGGFTFQFEYCTQMGYGFMGQMLLGCVVQSFGGDWAALVTKSPILYTLYGFLFGSLALFPALPFGAPYAAIHYGIHRSLHFKEPNAEENAGLVGK